MYRMLFGTVQTPTKLRSFIRIIKFLPKIVPSIFYDSSRYLKYSSSTHLDALDNLKSRLTSRYHEIEKGLSLAAPRPRFGAEKLAEVVYLVREYIRRYGADDFLRAPASTLRAYSKFHEERLIFDYPQKTEIHALLVELENFEPMNVGGTIDTGSAAIHAVTKVVSDDFFFKRYSIRQFSEAPVSREAIDAAIAIALKAPAVCNRQEGFVRVVENKSLIQSITNMHGGSRGFAEQIDKLLIITNKLTNFWGVGERNQCWIDGGLFSMNLILGLHAHGLGTCCLNWSKSAAEDQAMRDFLEIPESEVIIMLLAVGNIPEKLTVANSYRKPVTESREYIS